MDNEQHAPESYALPQDESEGPLQSLLRPVSLRILASPHGDFYPWQDKKKNAHKTVIEEMIQQGNDSRAAEEQLFSIWKGDKHPPNTER